MRIKNNIFAWKHGNQNYRQVQAVSARPWNIRETESTQWATIHADKSIKLVKRLGSNSDFVYVPSSSGMLLYRTFADISLAVCTREGPSDNKNYIGLVCNIDTGNTANDRYTLWEVGKKVKENCFRNPDLTQVWLILIVNYYDNFNQEKKDHRNLVRCFYNFENGFLGKDRTNEPGAHKLIIEGGGYNVTAAIHPQGYVGEISDYQYGQISLFESGNTKKIDFDEMNIRVLSG